MRRTLRTVKLLPSGLGLALLAACDGGGQIPVAEAEFSLEIAIEAENTRGEATLLGCQLLIDGQVLQDLTLGHARREVPLRGLVLDARPGENRQIAFRVTRQVGEQAAYQIHGDVTVLHFGAEMLREHLYHRKGRLSEGDELSWTFRFQMM